MMMATEVKQASLVPITAKLEDYLGAIYLLISESKVAIAARVAELLGVTPPTVLESLRRLQRQGLICITGRKEIRLTPQGQQYAETLMRRHRLMERFLCDVLGLDWRTAHEEAERLEHAISPLVEERLAVFLGDPATCPHGNPIPGSRSPSLLDRQPQVRLDECTPGQEATVIRIEEAAERIVELLTYLERHQIMPGKTVRVTEVADFNDTLTVQTPTDDVVLGNKAAARVWVHPIGAEAELAGADAAAPAVATQAMA